MSKALYSRSRKSDSGLMNTTFRYHLPVPLALELEYYQERAEEAAARRAKKKSPTKHIARRLGIAEDLREGMSYEAVVKKWGSSHTLMKDVEADMQVGKI